MNEKAASGGKAGKLDAPGRTQKKFRRVITRGSKRRTERVVRMTDGMGHLIERRIKELPRAHKTAAASMSKLVLRIATESGVIEAGKLMVRVFESQVAAASKPLPRSGSTMALLRGRVVREELKQEEGGSISSAEAAERLGISKTAVLKRYHSGQLLGWKEARQGAVRMPVWQFKEDNMLPGLRETLEVLNQASWMDDWGRVVFFLNRRTSLEGQRPLDLLRTGNTYRVRQSAMDAIE